MPTKNIITQLITQRDKKAKSKKLSKVAKDLFSVAMISAITEALNKDLTENNEKTEKDK